MAESVKLSTAGLAADPNEHGAGAAGAMRVATNVVSRRAGVLEPRQGFRPAPAFSASEGGEDHIAELVAVGDGVDLVLTDGASYVLRGSADPDTSYTGGDGLFTSPSTADAVESRGNVYYNNRGGASSAGVVTGRVLNGTTVAEAGYPFVPPPPLIGSTAAGSAILTSKSVAYRVTFERLMGDVLRVSPPSGRTVFTAGGSDLKVSTGAVYLPDAAAAGDVMRVWRSRNSAALPPSDQLFLCYRVELSATDISNGLVNWADNVADDDLGEALYTNPEREGPQASNFRPPACDAICAYQGSLFFGAITSPHRLTLEFPEGGDCSGASTGIGYRTADGTITGGGAATITSATTTGLKVGMMLSTKTGWTGTGFPIITDITGSTITVSHTYAGGSGAMPGSTYWYDTVRIKCADSADDIYFPNSGYPVSYFSNQLLLVTEITAGFAYATGPHTDVFAYNVTDGHQATAAPTDVVFAKVVLEKYGRDGAYFEVWATHGSEYDPPLPEPTVASGEQSTADEWLDAIYYSKRNEPEHVPLGNYIRVGTLGKRVLRMVPTTDAVWVFKEDGVYRVSGYGARSGFRVDPVMPSCVLLTPRCAKEMNGTVYAWTNLGPVSFGPGGFQRIGTGALESEFSRQQARIGQANTGSCFGVFVAVDPRHSEVMFGLYDSMMSLGIRALDGVDDYAAHLLVYNTRTDAWVCWGGPEDTSASPITAVSAAVFSPTDLGGGASAMVLGYGDALQIALEWTDPSVTGWAPNVDGYTTLTSESATGTAVTFSGTGTGYTPIAGDVIVNGDGECRVITVAGSGTATVHAAFTSALSGAYVGQAIKSVIGWQAWSEGHPGFAKLYRTLTVLWSEVARLYQWTLSYRRANASADLGSTTLTEATYENDDLSGYDASMCDSRPRRVFISREAARTPTLYPMVTVHNGSAQWSIHGVTLTHEPVSERVTYGT